MAAAITRLHPVPIVLAEDEALLASVLPKLLHDASSGSIRVVATCGSRSALLRVLRRTQPAIVVCDVRMPNRVGDPPTAMDERYLKRLFRQEPTTRVLLLTGQPDPLLAKTLIDAGAHGFLDKSIEPQVMCETIMQVNAGRRYVKPSVQAGIDQLEIRADRAVRQQLLVGRRGDVLRLLLDGQSAPEIAASLSVGRKYVDKRIAEIKRMTGADTPIRIYRACERLGIIGARGKH
jgi:DNA-binding NarL/FixJ family response regulator